MSNCYPERLTSLAHWVVSGDDKIPLDPKTRRRADTTNPATWSDYVTACCVATQHGLNLGFVFTKASKIVGTDLDHCRNAETGVIEPWALAIVRRLNTLTEISRSGTGMHMIAECDELPEGGRKKGQIEMYDSGRHFLMTGNLLPGYETLANQTDELKALHAEVFTKPEPPKPLQPSAPLTLDTEAVLHRVRTNDKGRRLHDGGDWKATGYPSQSEADQGPTNLFAAAGASRSQADDLFRRSALFREKWDQRRGDRTYGERTLDKAFDGSVRLWSTFTQPAQPPPGQDDHPPTVPDGAPCDVRLAAALRELANEHALRVAAEAARDHLQSQVDNLNDRWHWEQKVRETPTVQPEADLINACGWIYEATVNQPETYERPDGTRVFRKTNDGFVRTTRAELAQRTGKSERTITTKLAVAKKLGIIDVRHEPERIIDPETGEIQTVPDSTVIYFRPRESNVRDMHHRATSVTPAERLLATGKKHLHGGDRPACPSCGCDRRKIVCADCGYVFTEDIVLDSDVALSPTDTPLEKVAGNSKGAPPTVGRLRGVDKMTRGVGSNDAPSWLDDAPDLEEPNSGWMPGFEPSRADRYTDVTIGGRA